ncbi:hypothetical protein RUM44_008717 [Polyplax serrata]|uniref:Uncharacterized protein n=1 Tax=Polyplax serrata TaxID=468196 RepID=A0ABR1B915_POLSC
MCQRAESGERHRGKNTKSVSFFATVVAKDQCFIFAKAENSSGSPHVFGQTPEELREKKRWLNPFGGTPICRESADSAVSRRLCRLCLLSPDAAVSEFAQEASDSEDVVESKNLFLVLTDLIAERLVFRELQLHYELGHIIKICTESKFKKNISKTVRA